MKNCFNVIERLIVKSLFCPLSQHELKRLNDWQHEAREHEILYTKIMKYNNLASSYRRYSDIEVGSAWSRFKREIGYRPAWRPMLRMACGLLIPLLIGGIILFWKEKPGPELPFKTIFPGCSQAILTSYNGEKIMLCRDSLCELLPGLEFPDLFPQRGEISYQQAEEVVAEEEVVLPDNTLHTPRGCEYKITLADGTRVHLNYNTSLRYPVNFGKSARVVYLKGEAYFDVAPDTDRPFYVMTDNMTVKQYGTSFNINTYSPANSFVVLVKGSVSVMAGDFQQETLLKPGQKASVSTTGDPIDITEVDVENYIAWNKGYFLFEDETLENIMQTLSNWYNIHIAFESSELKSLHFTGNLDRYKDIGPALRAIGRSANLTFKIEDTTLYIYNPYANLKQ